MRTIALRQLCFEDIAFTGIHAAAIHWSRGNTTVYGGQGRANNLLFLMTAGRRRYVIAGDAKALEVREGDLMLMAAGSRYQSTVTSENGCDGIVLDFSLIDAEGRPVRPGEGVRVLERRPDARVRTLMEAIHGCGLQAGSMLRAKALTLRLMELLCEGPAQCADAELQPAVRFMETHLDRAVSLADAAALCHMSVSGFTRRFRAAMGDSPTGWHRRLRLDKGRELLDGDLYSVEQIAALLGFYDASHFCHAYAARFGETPGARRLRKRARSVSQ